MKNTISVYVIFAFLLMSFAGCGKLKNIVGFKDLTEKQVLGREIEGILERELKSFNLNDIVRPKCSAGGLRAVVDYRDRLVDRLIETKAGYYGYVKPVLSYPSFDR
jgi:hypothetical protein